MHLIKDVTKGLASTKCGLTNQSMFDVTVWWGEVTCKACNPYEWVPDPNMPNSKMLVRADLLPTKKSPPKRRLMREQPQPPAKPPSKRRIVRVTE